MTKAKDQDRGGSMRDNIGAAEREARVEEIREQVRLLDGACHGCGQVVGDQEAMELLEALDRVTAEREAALEQGGADNVFMEKQRRSNVELMRERDDAVARAEKAEASYVHKRLDAGVPHDPVLAREAKLREAAGWLVEQAYLTEDGQAYVVDPAYLRDLRAALAPEGGGT